MDNISDSMYINENENENEEDEYDENETEHDYTNPSICQNDQLTEIKKKKRKKKKKKKKNVLITYVFFESKFSLKNIYFFIKNGVYNNNNLQYNFIIKGDECSVKFPDYENIKIYKMENDGYDFGGYSYSIQMINTDDFDYFIFLNDTVIGPFVPRFNSKHMWVEYFISLISDKVKLVGPTINRCLYNNIPEHVQSMAFGTDKIGLNILKANNIFNLEYNTHFYNNRGKWEFIMNFEVGMSGILLDNGYEIASFMQCDNNDTCLLYTSPSPRD